VNAGRVNAGVSIHTAGRCCDYTSLLSTCLTADPTGAGLQTMGRGSKRACRCSADVGELPPCTAVTLYSGKEHHHVRLAECMFDSRAAQLTPALDRWVQAECEIMPIIVTFAQVGPRWTPLTIAAESEALRNEGWSAQYGLYAAREFSGGECLGAMSDGARLGPRVSEAALRSLSDEQRRYVCRLGRGNPTGAGVFDCSSCREGGPKRANDPRGTGLRANAVMYENGLLCVGAFSTIPGLRAGDQPARRARAEILWHYGAAFWA
jgi:hypothetical protein